MIDYDFGTGIDKGKIIVMRDGGTTTLLVIIVLASIIGLASSRWMGPDNKIEEISEEVILSATGLDIDLTPRSKEDE